MTQSLSWRTLLLFFVLLSCIGYALFFRSYPLFASTVWIQQTPDPFCEGIEGSRKDPNKKNTALLAASIGFSLLRYEELREQGVRYLKAAECIDPGSGIQILRDMKILPIF